MGFLSGFIFFPVKTKTLPVKKPKLLAVKKKREFPLHTFDFVESRF